MTAWLSVTMTSNRSKAGCPRRAQAAAPRPFAQRISASDLPRIQGNEPPRAGLPDTRLLIDVNSGRLVICMKSQDN